MTLTLSSDLYRNVFDNVRVGLSSDNLGFRRTCRRAFHAKFQPTGRVNTFREMSQIGRELSCNKIWTRAEKIKAGIVASAPSMAQNTEESRVYYGQKVAGSGGGSSLASTDNAEASHRGEGRTNRIARDMEKQCCQTAGAPQEELFNTGSRVGDSRSFSACATISETARELCKAVSVSLGLTMESVDTSDMDVSLRPCLLGVEAPSSDGAPVVVAGAYKCPSERPAGQEQLVEMFRSSADRLHDFSHTRTSVGEQSFALCEAEDVTTAEERDHLDPATHAECCTYGQSAAGAPAAERPCRLYKSPADEVRDFGEAMESKFVGYLPEPYGVRIKSEEPGCSRALWGNSYAFHDNCNNSQLWASRQCSEPRSAAANSALCTNNPYERSVMRPQQWYGGGMLRPPYPNSNYSTYLKAEVGEWLDVAYNDNR